MMTALQYYRDEYIKFMEMYFLGIEGMNCYHTSTLLAHSAKDNEQKTKQTEYKRGIFLELKLISLSNAPSYPCILWQKLPVHSVTDMQNSTYWDSTDDCRNWGIVQTCLITIIIWEMPAMYGNLESAIWKVKKVPVYSVTDMQNSAYCWCLHEQGDCTNTFDNNYIHN